MKTRGVFYFGKFVIMGFAFLALFTYVVMLLWNWLLPELFNGPVLNYWQTLGILVLSKILFAGLGGPRKDRSHWKRDSWKHDHMRSSWRKKFEEKMNSRCAESDNLKSEVSEGSGNSEVSD